MSFWYLASPYAHEQLSVREARALAVTRVAADLMSSGLHVFSPISHSHGLAELVQWSHDDWLEYDRRFLEVASGLIVAQLPGVWISKGVAWELEWAAEHKIPILLADGRYCIRVVGEDLWKRCDG